MNPPDLYLRSILHGHLSAVERQGPLADNFHAHGLWCEALADFFGIIRMQEGTRPPQELYLALIALGVCTVRWAVVLGVDPERFIEGVENHTLNNTEGVPRNLHTAYSHLRCHEIHLVANSLKTGPLNLLDAMLTVCALTSVHLVQPMMGDGFKQVLAEAVVAVDAFRNREAAR